MQSNSPPQQPHSKQINPHHTVMIDHLKSFFLFSCCSWLPFALVGTVEYISQAYAPENTLPPTHHKISISE